MAESESRAVIIVHRTVRVLLLIVVPVIAVLGGLYIYSTGGQEVETDNAYVKANIVAISSTITGKVIETLVQDNQQVAAGDLLFRLDPEPYQIAVSGARAQMDVVRSDAQQLRAEYRATLQEAAEGRERIEFLARQFERQERLKEKGMTRGDTYDEAHHNLEAAKRRGGRCLSTRYLNKDQKLEWECAKGHRWRAALSNIRQHGTWLVVENQTKSPWKDVSVTLKLEEAKSVGPQVTGGREGGITEDIS